jgi:PAS domain S-box-containing protein
MKQREQLAQIMVDTAPYAIAMADLEGSFIFANTAFYKLLGLNPDENPLVGEPITTILAENEAADLEEMIEHAINEDIWQGEARLAKQDGKPHFVQLNIFPLIESDRDEEPIALAAIMHDVTANKQDNESEERFQISLDRREQQLRLTTEIAQRISTSSNLEEIYQRVVVAVKEQFDYYHTQIFRHDPKENTMVVIEGYGEIGDKMVADGHNLPYGKGVVGTAASTGEPVLAADVSQDPYWVPHPDLPETKGELAVPIKWQDQVLGILDVQHNQPGALSEEDQLVLMALAGQIGIAIESARLLEELRQSEEEYRQLIENQGEGLGITDTEENFVFANPAAARIFGVPEGELVGRNLKEFVDEETYQDLGDQTEQRREGETSVYEFEFIRADGKRRTGLVTASPRYNQDGKFIGTFGIFRDITERIEAERKLNKRVQELNLISDVGHQIAEEPSIPNLLQWMAKRIPVAMQYPDICTVAIEYQDTLYGDPEAKALRCQNVAGIRVDGERVGRIYIAYTQMREFLDEESAMLGSVVQRLESYLARLQSTQELEQRARRERIIREVAARVRQRTDPEAIVRAAVRELGATLERPTFIRLGDAKDLSQPPVGEDKIE